MPPVSEKQDRAMHAAAGGHSTLGIPQSVGKEFVASDSDLTRAAGVLCLTEGLNPLALFVLRAGDRVWELPGGTQDGDENPAETAARELGEETGISLESGSLEPIHVSVEPANYVTHLAGMAEAVLPKLSEEHIAFAWAPLDLTPEPLRPEVRSLLDVLSSKTAEDIALDEASVRTTDDKTGHMHVAWTPISKADVNPYTGKEINMVMEGRDGWKPLDPSKIYHLLRDPEELEKGAQSFAGKPLLIIHKPVNSMNHPHRITVGAVGTDVKFEAPYLMAPLSVWDAAAIALIESGEQKELSSGYHYIVDMTPGKFGDKAFDGRMRDIRGNHVALVREGRAGSDVAVGDSMENVKMAKSIILSRKATLLQGALIAALPKIALDSKVDLPKALSGITQKNFTEKKAGLLADLTKQFKGVKIAQDADLESVARLIDAVEGQNTVDDDDDDEPEAVEIGDQDAGAVETGMDDESGIVDQVRELLEGVDPDKANAIISLLEKHEGEEEKTGIPAADAEVDEEEKRKKAPPFVAKDRRIGKDDKMAKNDKDMVTKTAMDEAIKTTADMIRKQARDVREAENFVRPILGNLAVACDSAEDVYKLALDHYGIDVKGVHPSAYRTLLDVRMKAGEKQAPSADAIAQDEAAVSGFEKRFGAATKRISVAA